MCWDKIIQSNANVPCVSEAGKRAGFEPATEPNLFYR